MVRQLEEETGEKVKYIVLPTFGYEHKVRGRGAGWMVRPGRVVAAARSLAAGTMHGRLTGGPWPSSRGWSPHVHPLTTLPQLPYLQIFVGPFSRRFPKAEVWVAPRWVPYS